jgi:hypothetical protein
MMEQAWGEVDTDFIGTMELVVEGLPIMDSAVEEDLSVIGAHFDEYLEESGSAEGTQMSEEELGDLLGDFLNSDKTAPAQGQSEMEFEYEQEPQTQALPEAGGAGVLPDWEFQPPFGAIDPALMDMEPSAFLRPAQLQTNLPVALAAGLGQAAPGYAPAPGANAIILPAGGQPENENFVGGYGPMLPNFNGGYQEDAVDTGVNGMGNPGEAQWEQAPPQPKEQRQARLVVNRQQRAERQARQASTLPAHVSNKERKAAAKEEKKAEKAAWLQATTEAQELLCGQGFDLTLLAAQFQRVEFESALFQPQKQYDTSNPDPVVAKKEKGLQANLLAAYKQRQKDHEERFEIWQWARFWVRQAGLGSVGFVTTSNLEAVVEDWVRSARTNPDVPVLTMGWVGGVWVN